MEEAHNVGPKLKMVCKPLLMILVNMADKMTKTIIFLGTITTLKCFNTLPCGGMGVSDLILILIEL